MQCPHLYRKRLVDILVGDAQAIRLHFFDMRRPHVDEGHVYACPRHMGAGIAADRPDPDYRDPFAHLSSPGASIARPPQGWFGPDRSASPRPRTIEVSAG